MEDNPILTIVVLAALGVGGYLVYKKLNPTINGDNIQASFPHGGSTVPSNFDANGLAKELHDAMGGHVIKKLHWYDFLPPAFIAHQFSSTDAEDNAWQKLYNQNDETIIAVYNVFNKKYGSEGNGTLTKWIEGTTVYLSGKTIKDKLLAKMRALKLN